MTPRVSILVMSHNYGRFLTECLESIYSQTFRDFEVILVNAGSTDNTAEVAKRYPVRYLEEPNLGLCTNRNRGFAQARGEYCMNLDADDMIAPQYLETVMKHAAPKTIVCTGMWQFGDSSWVGCPRSNFTLRDQIAGNQIYSCSLFPRAVFEQIGGYDPALDWLGCEDWELWIRMMKAGCIVSVIGAPLFHYRVHKNSHGERLTDPADRARYGWAIGNADARKYIKEKHAA